MEDPKSMWEEIELLFQNRFKKEADLKSVLYVIGLRDLGLGSGNYNKSDKEQIINHSVCRLLSQKGFFSIKKAESKWPEWQQEKAFPKLKIKEQEDLLKECAYTYLKSEGIL